MDARRLRQGKLPLEPTTPTPNREVVRKPLLSATTLASWTVCHTKPFVQRLLERYGIDLTTAAMRRGAEAHAEVQGALEAAAGPAEITLAEGLREGRFVFEAEAHLVDDRRRLHGYVDLIYARAGNLHVLELKNSRAPNQPDASWGASIWPDHAVQLHLYGLLARSVYDVPPRLHLGYLRGGSKEDALDELTRSNNPEAALVRLTERSVALPHEAPHRERILAEVQAFQRAERAAMIPPPNHIDPAICHRCSVRAWCPNRLDRPGEFVHFDPRLLHD
ncbi:MAG: PD-(D/E)XK nuclease family protein [Euryarchaeota archaeon]|nr:PD-(D/E)XK nuclease family protein [Euryarchaeota archaeon]